MLFLFEAMLVLYLAQFVILPIIICFTVKTAANPQFTTFDLAKPPIPLPSSYTQNLPVLESMGFELVAHVYSDTLSSRVRVALTVFVNRLEKDIAVVTHILSETPPATRLLVTFTEFSTEFEDGHEMNTSNSNQAALYVPVPEREVFKLPHVTNPRNLYYAHQALISRRHGVNKRLAPQGKEVDELMNAMKRDLAREASFGRVALDKSGEWFRPTLKGAFYNTVMFVWPVGKLRRALERRRGVRLVGGVLGHATF